MAVGDVKNTANAKRTTTLALGVTATVAAPTLPTDGIENYPDPVKSVYGPADRGICYSAMAAPNATLSVDVTGTTPTAIITVYGYLAASGQWYPIVTINGGGAVTTNFSQTIAFIGHYDRLALGFAAVGGTTPVFNAYISVARAVAY